MKTIASTASQLANASTTTAGSLVATLGSALGDFAGIASGLPGLPAVIDSAIAAGEALLPEFQMAVGIAPAAKRMTAAAMTPDQARMTLRALAAGI